MTQLQPYPAYKESGVGWLGEVPDGWRLEPLGQHFVERKMTVSDSEYRPLSVTRSGIVPQLGDVAKTENGDARKLVKAGDFAINSRSDRKGSAGVADRDGSVSVITTVITPRQMDSRFVHHLLRSVPFQEEYYRFGSGIAADLWSTRWSAMKGIRLAVPSAAEQVEVARFLDRETAEIDAFIADQEELIALLTERRAATISHAVTKGLDGSAPVKDSGLGSVGEIPASWDVWPFTRFAPHRVDYRGATPAKVNNGILLVTARNVKAGYIDYDCSAEYIAAESYADIMRRGVPELGDVLLTMEAPLGNVALVDRTDIALAQRLVKFTVKAGADPRFAVFAMISSYFQQQLLSRATGSTALGIKASKLPELRIAVPSDSEQKLISDYLDQETAEIDATILDAREAIALSKERRAALISAAVTGKIDVRGAAGHRTRPLFGKRDH